MPEDELDNHWARTKIKKYQSKNTSNRYSDKKGIEENCEYHRWQEYLHKSKHALQLRTFILWQIKIPEQKNQEQLFQLLFLFFKNSFLFIRYISFILMFLNQILLP